MGKQELFLWQVAPSLDMDKAQLSKIEKGIRQIKKEQIAILAEVLKTKKEELLTLWLADQNSNLNRRKANGRWGFKNSFKEQEK